MAKDHAQHAPNALSLAAMRTVTKDGHIRQTEQSGKHQHLLIARHVYNTIRIVLIWKYTVTENSRATVVSTTESRPELQTAPTTTKMASPNSGN